MKVFLQIILVASSPDTSESCHSQSQNQVSPWLMGPCPDAQGTLRYSCADRDLPPLATSWGPPEENQRIDSRAEGHWGENRLVRQLMPSHPRLGAGPLGIDHVVKMPYKKILSELGLCQNSELWALIASSGTRGQTGVLSPAFSRGRIPGTKITELAHRWSYRLNLEGLQESMSIALCVTPSHVSPATSDSHRVTCPEYTQRLFQSGG